MPLAADGLWKQPRKLRKSLKKLLEDSSAARVHQLRTRTRRMEAMVYALRLDFRKNERLLLKAIKPVRKKAGKVRDMDVLTGFASQPALNDEKECTVRLLEHLGGQRELHARKLEKVAGTAEELSQHTGCKLLKEIQATAQDKLEHALATTKRMRKSSLGTSTKGRRRRSSIQSFSRVAQPALVSVSALVA